MTKKIFAIIVLAITLCTGCNEKNNGGDIRNVQIPDWSPSELYSDDDIETACQTVKEYFSSTFSGCTLTKLYYPGDTYTDNYNKWVPEQYDADEAIVLLSSFDVDSSGGDGSLNPNSTYDNWSWILIRNKDGDWEHVDHGY